MLRQRVIQQMTLPSSSSARLASESKKDHWLVLEELSQEEQQLVVDDARCVFDKLSLTG